MNPVILFIDDDEFFLDSIKRTLHFYEQKWSMLFASNTDDAFKLLSDNTATVIVSDIMMPGMNGVEFFEIIQKTHPLVSRLVLSGNPKLETVVNALNKGQIFKYLMKPCNSDDLIQAIAEGIQKYNELNNLLNKANLDGLTGLFNKSFIEDKLSEEINRVKRYKQDLSILLLDIDHFKNVNDTFGHLEGDNVLATVADSLQMSIRATDFLGRYGGEEFLVIFTETSLETAYKAAERFRQRIKSLEFKNELIKVTISGGLKQYSGETAKQFLNKTDKLLYESKKNGRNRITK
ncbi:MAG: diguanylate cyclase [Calditrichaeota bacterium]|nr:MAG: diguanylate cyclase [Calditrichota bacterium]MBL1206828.1 diguanylate cyclase [Calditrichota bacterium]NOG46655.1 diguanylate cyclase [Calditrichota bacterium]